MKAKDLSPPRQSATSCASCGGALHRGVREQLVEYQGQSLRYSQPGWWCQYCDDGVLDGEDNEVHDAALHEVMARAKNSPISPLLIRAAREAVGLSQREAGRVFGGGPTAFYKYETAKAVPSEGMATLLRIALQHPELFRKTDRGAVELPTAAEIALAQRALKDDPLGTLIRQVYPDAAAE